MAMEGVELLSTLEVLTEIKALMAGSTDGETSAALRRRGFLTRYAVVWQRYGDIAAPSEREWISLATENGQEMKVAWSNGQSPTGLCSCPSQRSWRVPSRCAAPKVPQFRACRLACTSTTYPWRRS